MPRWPGAKRHHPSQLGEPNDHQRPQGRIPITASRRRKLRVSCFRGGAHGEPDALERSARGLASYDRYSEIAMPRSRVGAQLRAQEPN